ncbi:hypothetical protein KC799_23525 [candidate division KSB1 bacterium]|nr:hypothetical protein [candidate division KSB1 bacterium]
MISMKKFAMALLLVSFVLTSAPHPLTAQGRNTALGQLQQEYNLLNQKIESAKKLLANSNDDKIRTLIQEAEKRRDEALRYWNEKKYIKARTSVELALKTINVALQLLLREPLTIQAQQLNVLLQRIEQFPDRSSLRDAERLYREAKDKESLAKLSATGGDYAKALELYRLGITLANKALTTLEKTQTIIIEQSRFLDTASRVRDAIDASGSSTADRVYEQAIKQGKNAASAYRDGQPAVAAELYTEAMKLLLRAFDLASGSQSISERDLQIELSAVENLLQNAQTKFNNSSVRGVKLMLNRAQRNTINASTAIARGEYQLARAQLKFARGIINKLYRQETGAGTQIEERAVAELQRLEQDIESANSKVSTSSSTEVSAYIGYARQSAASAEMAIQNQRYNIALNRILIGQRFLAKAEDSINANLQDVTEAVARVHVTSLEQSLQQAKLSDNRNQFVNSLLKEASRMLQQANKQLSDQQFALAYELADVGLDLVQKALRAAQNQ